jgi:cell wall-associated NlpC family hydrolase
MVRISAVMLLALALGACASTGARPQPFPGARPGPDTTPAPAPPSPATAGLGYSIAGTALALRGSPYRNGGSDPSGFDCSGFVRYVFEQYGRMLPRSVSDQFRAGRDVAPAALEPGDLVFFTTVAPGASHVGISIGGDEFVHAPSSNGVVRVERLSGSYWAPRFVGAKRVTAQP